MEQLVEAHKDEYGEKPAVMACAPGRVHLLGEHTWFFKDKTLSMAVNLPVYIGVSKRSDANLRFNFVQLKEKKRSTLSSLKYKKEDKWANAIKSVIYGFGASGFECSGMNFTVYSEILPSAGFGITNAVKIASAWAIKELHRFKCPLEEIMRVLERANMQFYGNAGFKADNFTVIHSKENSLVLTDYAKNTFDIVPFKFKDKIVVLTDARVPRITTWNEESLFQPENVLLLGELKERRANVYGGWYYADNGPEVNEVLSVVNEDLRRHLVCVMNEHKNILKCEAALRKEDFASFARAVNHSHEDMRVLYDISCPEIDWLLKRVQELDESPDDLRNPVNCGRITGKGFGRCTYTILRKCDLEAYKEKLAEYERIFRFKPEFYVVKPAKGVRLI